MCVHMDFSVCFGLSDCLSVFHSASACFSVFISVCFRICFSIFQCIVVLQYTLQSVYQSVLCVFIILQSVLV